MRVPWHDEAVVVRHGRRGAPNQQINCGPLWRMIEWVEAQSDRARLSLHLHNRTTPPFSFDPEQARALLRVPMRPNAEGFGGR